jgi:hypothetical protein
LGSSINPTIGAKYIKTVDKINPKTADERTIWTILLKGIGIFL